MEKEGGERGRELTTCELAKSTNACFKTAPIHIHQEFTSCWPNLREVRRPYSFTPSNINSKSRFISRFSRFFFQTQTLLSIAFKTSIIKKFFFHYCYPKHWLFTNITPKNSFSTSFSFLFFHQQKLGNIWNNISESNLKS